MPAPRTVATVVLFCLAAVTTPAVGFAAAQDGTTSTAGGCSYPVTMTDATGTTVTVDERPETVVALQASDAQTMWEIGAREQVVAMPIGNATAYLEDRGDRTRIQNDDGSTDAEVVVNTSADLVLAANITRPGTIQTLRDAGMTVYHFREAKSLGDVSRNVNRTGRLTGNCEAATERVDEMQTDVREVRTAVAGRDRPRVLYYFYQFTAGNQTFVHDVIEAAGGENVAADANITGFRQINPEVVAARDPQWIVRPSTAPLPTGAPFNGTTAYERNQTLSVNANYVNQPAPRVVVALRTMARAFHPAAFEAGNATATDAGDTASGSGPGPGFVGVLLAAALITAAAWVRRQA